MSLPPQAALLPDGRLHLNHGPIDLVIGVEGPRRTACYQAATERFQTVLDGLSAELPHLRRPVSAKTRFHDAIAQRMKQAVRGHKKVFVTPMAAVAGAVADEILAAMVARHAPKKAYVNNGGDIALHLAGREKLRVSGPLGRIVLSAEEPVRGVATSGWRGRSHSRGIADAVTVLARTAAAADVAATLIANTVDLPGHPAVARVPATDLSPDSDLGHRLVTTDVATLPPEGIARALQRGKASARAMIDKGHIIEAALCLQGRIETVSACSHITQGTLAHA